MNIDMIRAAADRVRGAIRRTPLLSAPALDALAWRRVLVKAECLQHTGSFKARDGWAEVTSLPEGSPGILAMSSGNHGQGVAQVPAHCSLPCVVLMPADAPQTKIEGTRASGAEVVLYDRLRDDRDALGASREGASARAHSPFDHPKVIAGQGTIGLEIAVQTAEEGVAGADVLVCCGGGGLSAGLALALADEAPGLRIRTVEARGFDDVARSFQDGETLRDALGSTTLCDAIMTPMPGRLTFPILQAHCGPGLAVTDEEALRAVALAFPPPPHRSGAWRRRLGRGGAVPARPDRRRGGDTAAWISETGGQPRLAGCHCAIRSGHRPSKMARQRFDALGWRVTWSSSWR